MSNKLTSLVEDYKKGKIQDPEDFRQQVWNAVTASDYTMVAGRGKQNQKELTPNETAKAVELATMFQLAYRAKGGDFDARKQVQRVEGATKSALVEGDNSLGGYTVDDEFMPELIQFIKGNSTVLPLCRTMMMNRDVMKVPTADTKLTVSWSAESDTIPESNPTFGEQTLDTKRLNTYTTVSNELLEDSNLAIQEILLNQFAEAVGQELDNTILNGDGSGSAAFSGVFTTAVSGSTVFGSGSTAFSEVLISNFLDLANEVPAYVRNERNSGFVLHPDVWAYIQKVQTSTGEYLIDPFNTMRNPMIWGYPVNFAHEAPAPSDSGADKAFIAFGNWNYLGVGIRNRSHVLVDPYSNGLKYQTNFVMVHRYAFAILKAAAFARMMTAAS